MPYRLCHLSGQNGVRSITLHGAIKETLKALPDYSYTY